PPCLSAPLLLALFPLLSSFSSFRPPGFTLFPYTTLFRSRMGHLEGLASGPGTLQAYRRSGGQAGDTRELVAQAEAGNALAARVLDRCAHAVGRMIGAMLNVFDVEAVVRTGGMAGAGQLWRDGGRGGGGDQAMERAGGA